MIDSPQHNCDDCKTSLGEGDLVYCKNCYQDKLNEINDLQERIDSLNYKIIELEIMISEYDGIST